MFRLGCPWRGHPIKGAVVFIWAVIWGKMGRKKKSWKWRFKRKTTYMVRIYCNEKHISCIYINTLNIYKIDSSGTQFVTKKLTLLRVEAYKTNSTVCLPAVWNYIFLCHILWRSFVVTIEVLPLTFNKRISPGENRMSNHISLYCRL